MLYTKYNVMRGLLVLLLIGIFFAGQACPLCNSSTAKQIRASLMGPDLPFNLFITTLPFIVFSIIVYFIYHGGRPAKKSSAPYKNKKS